MSQRFYINWPLAPGPVELAGPEAHHLANVSRLRAGDELRLFNGDGHEYPARVLAAGRRTVRLEVLAAIPADRELAFNLEIAAPLPKGDRAQFLVEKLTELGVTTFVPLECSRAVIHPGEGKIDKLERHVIEASKQCGRNILMHIAASVDWATYCCRGQAGEMRVVAHPKNDQPGGYADRGIPTWSPPCEGGDRGGNRIRCAVGPEGGFTEEEIALARAHEWTILHLGPRTLRLETAAIYLATWAILLTEKP